MKLNKYQIAIIIGILSVILVAWIDIQGFNLLGDKYTNGDFSSNVWPHHLLTAIIIFLIPALCYFFFYRRDKSETLAIFLTGLTLFYFSLADIFYFWLQNKSIPETLSWLTNHPIIGKVALLTNNLVTPITLYTSVVLGFILVYFITKFLKDKF
jgi:hypothetical protein